MVYSVLEYFSWKQWVVITELFHKDGHMHYALHFSQFVWLTQYRCSIYLPIYLSIYLFIYFSEEKTAKRKYNFHLIYMDNIYIYIYIEYVKESQRKDFMWERYSLNIVIYLKKKKKILSIYFWQYVQLVISGPDPSWHIQTAKSYKKSSIIQ